MSRIPDRGESAAHLALRRLLSQRIIGYSPALATALGSVTAAVLFAQLFYWQERGSNPDGWIWKTREELTAETALTRYEQETARKILVRAGVLEEVRRGVPARMHFRIGPEQFARVTDLLGAQLGENYPTGWRESAQQVSDKPPSKRGVFPPSPSTENTQETTQRSKYTRGRYAVCPVCGSRPCTPECPRQLQEGRP